MVILELLENAPDLRAFIGNPVIKEEAKKAYQEALKRFGPKDPYARFTEEKLESLGV